MKHQQLTCIDLDQPSLTGFRNFISCWLYRDDRFCFVVDPGPLSTIPVLCEKLKEHRIEKLDFILLTHIHIDHAGGTGELLKFFPDARVFCHPQGIKHLIEPEKLWLGSRKVLGKLADAYGEIVPLSADSISYADSIHDAIRVVKTPGHAQHHCCYLLDDLLIGGEVAGVHQPVGHGIYMRPATPPKFVLDIALASIRQMIELNPRQMIIAHHGMVEPAIEYLNISHYQLQLWVRIVIELVDSAKEDFRRKAIERLLLEDRYFCNITQLEQGISTREYYFLDNSLRGMRDFVLELSSTEREKLRTELTQH